MRRVYYIVMIYPESSYRDARNEYNKDEEEKDNRQHKPAPKYPLLR